MITPTRRSFLVSSALGVSGVTANCGAAVAADNPQPKGTYRLTRDIPIEEGFDIVVAGGGPAGAAAAICAARLGAKVLLVEATGCMGGMGTNALVSNWYCLGDGAKWAVGGLIGEVIHALCREKMAAPAAIDNFEKGKYIGTVGFNPEGLKLIFDRLCREASVEVRFFTRVIDADVEADKSRVNGVVTVSSEGYRCIRAAAFIDCTGDAILSELCGAKSRAAGRDTPNIMPPTLCAMIADIDYENTSATTMSTTRMTSSRRARATEFPMACSCPGAGRISGWPAAASARTSRCRARSATSPAVR